MQVFAASTPQIFPAGVAPQQFGRSFQDVSLPATELGSSLGGLKLQIKNHGFGVDLDGDGQFQGNRDGVLAFDINKDGKVDQMEVNESNRRLKLLMSNEPIKHQNGILKGTTDLKAEAERAELRKQYDKDGDGKLNAYELQVAGGKMLVDSNQDGKFEATEAQDLRALRTDAGAFALKSFDLRGNYSVVDRGNACSPWAEGSSRGWGACRYGY